MRNLASSKNNKSIGINLIGFPPITRLVNAKIIGKNKFSIYKVKENFSMHGQLLIPLSKLVKPSY